MWIKKYIAWHIIDFMINEIMNQTPVVESYKTSFLFWSEQTRANINLNRYISQTSCFLATLKKKLPWNDISHKSSGKCWQLCSIDELPKWRHTQSLYFINFKSVYDSLKCTRFVVPSHSDSHRFITLRKAFLR